MFTIKSCKNRFLATLGMTTCVKHGAVGRGGEAAATNCIPLYNNIIPNVVRNLCLRRFSLNITVISGGYLKQYKYVVDKCTHFTEHF